MHRLLVKGRRYEVFPFYVEGVAEGRGSRNYIIMIKKFCFIIAIALSLNGLYAATYTVTNTNDSGAGSLRQAMTDATGNYVGNHTINFNIPTTDTGYDAETGTFTIHLQSELPYLLIASNITIDGTSQTANQGNTNPNGPEIVLDGGNMNLMSCFRIASANNTIKGFVIGGFQYAVLLFGANGGTISDCYIGIAADGVTPFPNQYGIGLSGGTYGTYNLGYARNVTIRNNVLSGNTAAGIVMEGSGTQNNVVVGNRIGVSANGDLPLSNHYGIIVMTNANNNRIGGAAAADRNIISANTEIGIYIESADSNVVCGNYIGVDATGTRTFEYAPDSAIQANGVEINTTGKHNIIGGSTPEARNIISGNRVYGCIYYGNCSQNNIAGNYIGTDVTGTVAIPNATGICVDGSSNHNIMENNLLSGNRSYGLFIVTRGTDGNIFRGNKVGTDATGTAALPNDVGLMLAADAKDNVIGGDAPEDRNLFSGNMYAGIEVTDAGTENNRIAGNYIGVDATGNQPLSNANGLIISALVKHLDIDQNVISANSGFGVVITDRADSNVVRRNKIGTGVDTLIALGNGGAGVLLGGGATHNRIGGDGEGNVIAHNDSTGIVLTGSARLNRFSQNAIYQNQYAGIYFMDNGCNDNLQPPVITAAHRYPEASFSEIRGTINADNPQSFIIEIFVAEENENPLFPAQASRYLGQTFPDGNGNWEFYTSWVGESTAFVATVTDVFGNTSPFSASLHVNVQPQEMGGFNIWPNPTDGMIHVETDFSDIQFLLYDISGKLLMSGKENTVNLSHYPAGVYFLHLYNGRKMVGVTKVVKQ